MTTEIQALLAYLILHRHRVLSRDVLLDIFWGEYSQKKARGSLNTALWKLKKILEQNGIPSGTYLISDRSGVVAFNKQSQYWLDVEIFESEIKRLLATPLPTAKEIHVVNLEKRLALYQGELLEGFYQDWALHERERTRALYLKSLIYLMQYYALHQEYEQALAYGQKILDMEPLREEIHRKMMELYVANGQRALSVRQYEICSSMLANEFGISPMGETQALYTQVSSSDSPTLSKKEIDLNEVIRQLKQADKNIDIAKRQIQRALQLLGNT